MVFEVAGCEFLGFFWIRLRVFPDPRKNLKFPANSIFSPDLGKNLKSDIQETEKFVISDLENHLN